MIIKQLSVFLENKTGRLFSAADALAQRGINIRALSLADTSEYGILRMIVDQPEEGRQVLMQAGVVVSVSDVLALPMADVPGGTLGALHLMADNHINVEYMYACVGQSTGKALMIMQVDDRNRAEALLREKGFGQVDLGDF